MDGIRPTVINQAISILKFVSHLCDGKFKTTLKVARYPITFYTVMCRFGKEKRAQQKERRQIWPSIYNRKSERLRMFII